MTPFDYANDLFQKSAEELLEQYNARSLFGIFVTDTESETLPIIDSSKGMHLKYNKWRNIADVIEATHASSVLLYQGADMQGSFEIKDILLKNQRIYPMQLTPEIFNMFCQGVQEDVAKTIVDTYNNR